uniref:JmjC domain-containing protein n=1 Tax=Spongospora subterranea TaxID=70186 RepID=A0A0H5RBR1_9EUKA|eukprot:CRZ11221.1 hypothetical protein [Spongospora subterranea]
MGFGNQGHRTVLIEKGTSYQHDPEWRPVLMTIAEFIDNHLLHHDKNAPIHYLAQNELFEQVPELASLIQVPDYIEFDPEALGDIDDGAGDNGIRSAKVRSTIWFGPGGTRSPLHNDPQNNLLCQVVGRKYIRLYDDEHRGEILSGDELDSNTSSIDLTDPNRNGEFSKVPFLEGVLKPGDLLFIPKGMWHYVESLSTSFSVNFWWWF